MQGSALWLSGEPSLEEMLKDPIVRSLMERDGLSEAAVRGSFERAAMRLRAAAEGVGRAA